MNEKKERQRGLVIAFEGVDGAGKSTQCDILARKFSAQGWPVQILSHRIDDPVDRMLSDLAVDQPVDVMPNRFAIMATFLCRQEWVIRPLGDAGKSFIYDKYLLSFLAREIVRGGDADELKVMIRQLAPPDLAIVLEVSAETALMRKNGEVNYRESGLNLVTYEDKPVSPARFRAGAYPQEWVRQCYLDHQNQVGKALARMLDDADRCWNGKFGRSIVRLPGTTKSDELAGAVWQAVSERMAGTPGSCLLRRPG